MDDIGGFEIIHPYRVEGSELVLIGADKKIDRSVARTLIESAEEDGLKENDSIFYQRKAENICPDSKIIIPYLSEESMTLGEIRRLV